jgi:hypothetical protein
MASMPGNAAAIVMTDPSAAVSFCCRRIRLACQTTSYTAVTARRRRKNPRRGGDITQSDDCAWRSTLTESPALYRSDSRRLTSESDGCRLPLGMTSKRMWPGREMSCGYLSMQGNRAGRHTKSPLKVRSPAIRKGAHQLAAGVSRRGARRELRQLARALLRHAGPSVDVMRGRARRTGQAVGVGGCRPTLFLGAPHWVTAGAQRL